MMKKPTLDGAISAPANIGTPRDQSNSIQPAERLPFRCLAAYRVPTLCLSDAARSSVVAVVPVVAVIVGGANTPIE